MSRCGPTNLRSSQPKADLCRAERFAAARLSLPPSLRASSFTDPLYARLLARATKPRKKPGVSPRTRGGWSALARSAKTPQESEYAAMLLAALVVSWNRFAITPMTESARAQFDVLVRAKLNVKHNDLRIAAIAKEIGATVVTRNRRDFGRVPGLVIADWAT
jgi:predicted nucleic acid-binding protein